VFEVSATATPMNAGTPVLSTKALEDEQERAPTHSELERELIRQGLITSPANAEQYQQADPSCSASSGMATRVKRASTRPPLTVTTN